MTWFQARISINEYISFSEYFRARRKFIRRFFFRNKIQDFRRNSNTRQTDIAANTRLFFGGSRGSHIRLNEYAENPPHTGDVG